MSLIDNERTKLLANAFDRLSTACLTVGLLAPTAALVYGVNGIAMQAWVYALSSAAWFVSAGILHLVAQVILGRLKS